MLIPKFTSEFRLNELAKGERSLLYFGVSILGFDSWDKRLARSTLKPFHADLCHFLEGRGPHYPWNRAVVSAFRGSGKSIWANKAYSWWRGLYILNWSCKIISNSSDSARVNHFAPMLDLFVSSRRADYLQWLYHHRIPTGFAGWNSEQIKLVQTDAMAMPFLSYWGMSSKFEGYHGNCIIIDDPEGADAEKSSVGNIDAHAVWERAHPLLISQNDDQILMIATPHGDHPVVYKLRDQENWTGANDNERSAIKFFWLEVEDESGNSRWPEKISNAAMSQLRKLGNSQQQYWLRRRAESATIFDMKAVQDARFRYLPGSDRKIIEYPGYSYDPDKLTDDGFVIPERKKTIAELRRLRFHIHFDPLHKTKEARRAPGKSRPAKAAIVVVGVAADLHAFVVDRWQKDGAELHEQAIELFRLYRIWQPWKVTFESVGAQFWLMSHIKTVEGQRPDWQNPQSTPHLVGFPIPLPRMSARLAEASKTIESKESEYRESLAPYVNLGVLHLEEGARGEEIAHQLDNVLNEDETVDLIDALAQGPKIWKGPRGAADVGARDFHARKAYVENMVKKTIGAAASRLPGGRRWR